jgi:RNA polymerase sigma-70 factor, ECF subfamily
MTMLETTEQWTAALAGDQDAFQQLTDPYRHELLVHCYRILGSLDDAEDALQEILLRAWRRLDSLRAQAALRAWLYKIATHVSLDMLDSRKMRIMPTIAFNPADPDDPLPEAISEPIWFDPLPDIYLDGYVVNPEARYEAHESITLAFLAALQNLPGRQRAILILRDVMGWKAQEVADLLDLTVVAVNSALQRARATLKKVQYENTSGAADNERVSALLRHYVQAWEAADSTQLIRLLREDAVLTMPPVPAWYQGRAAIVAFLDQHLFRKRPHYRVIETRANGCPAFAVYERDSAGVYRPAAIQVLTIQADQITRIDDFLTFDGALFSRFDLPLTR